MLSLTELRINNAYTLLKHVGGLGMDKEIWARKLKQYRGGKENIFTLIYF